MLESREGGCLCGSVRYRAFGEPLRAHACHCTFCQRRTGSAFAEVAYFLDGNIEVTGGALTSYTHRSDVSGRWLRMEFCPTCGTCVTIALERRPGELGSRTSNYGPFERSLISMGRSALRVGQWCDTACMRLTMSISRGMRNLAATVTWRRRRSSSETSCAVGGGWRDIERIAPKPPAVSSRNWPAV